jgi:hypothetical protein
LSDDLDVGWSAISVPSDRALLRQEWGRTNLAQIGYEFLSHPVSEVVLLGVVGKILKWKHRNRDTGL